MEIKLVASKFKIKIDKKKVIENLLDFKVGSVMTEVFSKESDLTAEESAFNLIFNVTRLTNIELAKELDQDIINRTENLTNIIDALESEWTKVLETEVTLTKDFLNNIVQSNTNYLTSAFRLFDKYFGSIGIIIPLDFHFSYYEHFRENLRKEYVRDEKNYEKISLALNNPIVDANDSFNKQINHYRKIQSFYTSKLQSSVDESRETLKDLYIAPNFNIHSKNLKKYSGNQFEPPKVKTDINSFLNDFVLNDSLPEELRDNYNIRPLQGYPVINNLIVKQL